MNILIKIILFVFVILLVTWGAYIGKQIYDGKTSIDLDLRNAFKSVVDQMDLSKPTQQAPVPRNVCTFSRIDLLKGRILDDKKQVVKYEEDSIKNIDCDTCKNYTYKTDKGCNKLLYDMLYSGTGLGICSSSLSYPTKCV